MAANKRGWFYVASNTIWPDVCKIGETVDLKARERQLSQASPYNEHFKMRYWIEVPDREKWEEAFRALLERDKLPDRLDWYNVRWEAVANILKLVNGAIGKANAQLTPLQADVLKRLRKGERQAHIAKALGKRDIQFVVKALRNKGLWKK